ncbi:MAG: XRE family transcriptional regulator [Oscillospiraceae bacterium]|nr:XRE family transcriptional regulator [Oscillospiraceae bacterium]
MDYLVSEILGRVKGMRTVEGLTPNDVAERLGIPVEDYLRYENGEEDFSVTFLSSLAAIYGIDLMELMSGEKPKLSYYSLVRSGKGLPFKRMSGFTYHHLAPVFKDKEMEPFLCVSEYKEDNETKEMEFATHDGHEMDYVLSGKLCFRLQHKEGDETIVNEFILSEGDTIYYDSSNPHGMISVGGEDCIFLAVLHVKEEG